ncbi:ShlB/FhaC/HecB family hemolysin secretion/activation protein [Solimonas sp. K1W22B-7]|uniref:ShlB/FhaC/HecB family hemolysin secretion/activation protein n=1 Tax=Solimonas sp. K1W22B-7 TaxID=2303331 RepID=UPI000E3342CF|nr:ShlB/FhaC/HecB family hemolysin secretion/activation protein [Solimonas sp. K1W22B-7]AXQ30360.1 ShlB/FhaC/HecB family hemolysin secretion/activation protein [Solimonas sp. K1W22B-7]
MGLRQNPSCALAPLLCLLAGASLSAHAADGAAPAEAAAPPAEARSVVPVAGRSFDIREIQVEGNTVLEAVDIETVLEFFVGENRSAADVDGARAALEKLYKEMGYNTVSVTIPRQTIQDGLVLLQVSETQVGRTIVEGGDYTSIAQVKKEVPSLAPGMVPNLRDVQRDMVHANRLATRRVTPALESGREPGTLDVKLKVEDDLPLSASLGYNNEHARGTTDTRLSLNLSYDNLFQIGHSFKLLYMTAPERTDDGTTLSATYQALMPDPSWSMDFTVLKTDSDIALRPGVNSVTDNLTVGFSASKRFSTSIENWYPSLSFGADYKSYKSTLIVRSAQGSLVELAPVDYLPINLTFSQTYASSSHRIDSSLAAIFTSGVVGSQDTELDFTRYGAEGQSIYLRASLGDQISLPRGFSINARLTGQITGQALLPAEKLSAGGIDTVRGYFDSEASADRGLVGNLELRLPSLPDYFASHKWASYLTELQPYLFTDAARLIDHGPFPDGDAPRDFTLFSAGAGLSARLREYVSLDLVWAKALQDVPFTLELNTDTPSGGGAPTASGDDRVLFRLLGSF